MDYVCTIGRVKYDAIILLGTQPDPQTWEFPRQIHDCVEAVARLMGETAAPFVIASGKWSIDLEKKGLAQPFEECDGLADLLIKKSVDPDKILRERNSKDTISNLYYIKEQFLIPQDMKKLLFVVASFRIPRLKFLVHKILGEEYEVVYESVEAETGPSYNESRTMRIQSEFLKPMQSGEHAWLADKFYEASIYK